MNPQSLLVPSAGKRLFQQLPTTSGPTRFTHGVTLNTTTNASLYTTASFTPAPGDLLLLFTVVTGSTQLAATGPITDSLGGTWTPVGSAGQAAYALKAASVDGLWCFIRDKFSDGTALTVSVNSAAAGTGCIAFVVRVSGMSRTGVNGVARQAAHQDNLAGGTTPATTFPSAALTTNPTLAFTADLNNPAAMIPPVDWLEQADTGYATPTTGGEYATRPDGFASTTITWGSAGVGSQGSISVELDMSAPVSIPPLQPYPRLGPLARTARSQQRVVTPTPPPPVITAVIRPIKTFLQAIQRGAGF